MSQKRLEGVGASDGHADTWVIVPVFNEADVVGDVVRDLLKTFPNVVCVDDGSDDESLRVLRETGARVVAHPLNLGQGAALQTGVEYALLHQGARYFVTFDSDGQHQVSDAEDMVARLRQDDVDIVFGSRFLDERTEITRAKRAILRMAVLYTNATSHVRLSDAHNGLRAFNRAFAERLRIRFNGMAHASEIVHAVAEHDFRYAEMPVHIIYSDYSRRKGQSMLNAINILFDLVFR